MQCRNSGLSQMVECSESCSHLLKRMREGRLATAHLLLQDALLRLPLPSLCQQRFLCTTSHIQAWRNMGQRSGLAGSRERQDRIALAGRRHTSLAAARLHVRTAPLSSGPE